MNTACHSVLVKLSGYVALAGIALGSVMAVPAWAQPNQPRTVAASVKRPQAPADFDPLPAVVIEVNGTVEQAMPGVSVLEEKGWTPIRWKDELAPGTQIRTGLRSSVHLQFGKTTVIALRSATHASLDQLYRSATTEHVHIGLGYGTVRGGSVEGKIHSDIRVDSTVATLAKRGTEGWEMQVEKGTGRFRISLAEFGLVEAFRKLRSVGRNARTVRPGEYVSDANIANMWIKQDIFDRRVKFYESSSITVADADFNTENPNGLGVVAPGGGATVASASGRLSSEFVLQQVQANFVNNVLPPTTVLLPTSIPRSEGNFGTGRTFKVLLPATARNRAVDAGAGLRFSRQRQ